MVRQANSFRIAVLIALLTVVGGGRVHAHFPWLTVDAQGRALLFFGESPAERDYHFPDALAQAKLFARTADDKPAEIAVEAVDDADFVGRRSAQPVAEGAVLECTSQYGVYHGMLLTYYAKHVPGSTIAAWGHAGPSRGLRLDARPKAGADGLAVAVSWEGKPLAGAGVTLVDSAGERQEAKTNDQGIVDFQLPAAGLVGVIVSHDDKQVKGEHEGQAYSSAAYYGTLTFNYQGSSKGSAGVKRSVAKKSLDRYPPLPEPVSSFGAAACDGYLYVYSGHTGEEHAHSRDNLSRKFMRIKLGGGSQWEELPMQTPLQGLPLTAYGGKLYRAGGLSAKNAPGEEEILHSVAEFACYDPATKKWTALSPLPEPRSSHDAVAIGDRLYVVGGWTLDGDRQGDWLDTAWSIDLTNPQAQWEPVASPIFRRRALAAAHWNGKLVALGGINEDVEISRAVHALDLSSGEWTELAKLPGKEMDGFGVSAWNLDGKLYASGTQDSLYRLADDGQSWEAVVELRQPRFFHRLLPAGEPDALLAVAGASFKGHLASVEELSTSKPPQIR